MSREQDRKIKGIEQNLIEQNRRKRKRKCQKKARFEKFLGVGGANKIIKKFKFKFLKTKQAIKKQTYYFLNKKMSGKENKQNQS